MDWNTVKTHTWGKKGKTSLWYFDKEWNYDAPADIRKFVLFLKTRLDADGEPIADRLGLLYAIDPQPVAGVPWAENKN